MRLRISVPRILFFVLAVCASVMIFTSSFFNVLYDEEFFMNEYRRLGDQVTVTEPEIKAQAVVRYLSNDEDLMYQSEVIFTDKQMTVEELEHMRDVKDNIEGAKQLYFVSFTIFFLLLIGFSWTLIHKYKKEPKQLKDKLTLFFIKLQGYILIISTSVLIIGGIMITFFFQQSFRGMHELLFPQGNWMFPADSLLISLFPQQFFIDFSIQTLGVILKFVILLIILFVIIYFMYMMKRPKGERFSKSDEVFDQLLAPFWHRRRKRKKEAQDKKE